ncbi:hypothetical protein [Leifsonia aquatica]|uniref:hypothetical protein n=1 Tax=Leifsonia aquatica TaxID=144185 RepID=UPI00046806E4|nr:hypothetical protein [Leifsonia aquatica]
MNDTNRASNRILLALVGLAALAAAAAAVLLLAAPAVAHTWAITAGDIVMTADRAFGAPLWRGTTVSGAAVIALAASVVLVLLLIALALRQGHGSTSTIATIRTDDGFAEIDTAVTVALLEDRLSKVVGVAGVGVSAYRVRRTPALKVTVRCRRGASPRQIADALDDAVQRLHAAIGTPIPVFAQLVGGFRTRLRSAVRVDTSTSAARPS